MNCSELQNKILDYLYGDAAPTGEAAAHLQSCSQCQQEWDKMAHARHVFSQLPEVSPPQMTVNRVLAYARSHGSVSPRGFAGFIAAMRSRFSSFGFNLAPVAMVAMLLLAVGFVFLSPQQEPGIASYGPGKNIILTGGAALRERLLENPFALTAPTLTHRQSQPKTLFFGDLRAVANESSPFEASVLPEAGLSIEEMEKKLIERRKMLLEADADSLMMRGRRLKTMGRVDLALRDFETIYRFYPDYTYLGDVLMYRAQCYAFQGNYDKALESLEIYTGKYPSKKPLIQPMIDQLEAQKGQQ